jgi:hypothetical protein
MQQGGDENNFNLKSKLWLMNLKNIILFIQLIVIVCTRANLPEILDLNCAMMIEIKQKKGNKDKYTK